MRKWSGSGSASTYLFYVVCFGIGFVIVKAMSLGQLEIDDPDNHGWSPLVRKPDGRWAIGDYTVSCIGFVVIMALCWLVSQLSRH